MIINHGIFLGYYTVNMRDVQLFFIDENNTQIWAIFSIVLKIFMNPKEFDCIVKMCSVFTFWNLCAVPFNNLSKFEHVFFRFIAISCITVNKKN